MNSFKKALRKHGLWLRADEAKMTVNLLLLHDAKQLTHEEREFRLRLARRAQELR